MDRILVIGANGQIGSELVDALAARHGTDNVIAADIGSHSMYAAARYQAMDTLDSAKLAQVIEENGVTQVYQLAAILSATGEQAPLKAWSLNIDGLLNVLEIARGRSQTGKPLRVFWPSSIAVFGPHTPAIDAPQLTVMDPTTMYGISKLAGERLCEYYFIKFGVDVRSIRYPGIVSHKSPPGGGTTDYAIAIFHAAQRNEPYLCYLAPETTLPMIYMPDAIRAAIELMDTPAEQVRIRSAYNVAGLSFNPRELAQAIKRHVPQFEIAYKPDQRQEIAGTWPHTVDDAHARADWNWHAEIGLQEMAEDMLAHIKAPRPDLHHAA
jgi:nucleoside-diphosphate-sugar epimerase